VLMVRHTGLVGSFIFLSGHTHVPVQQICSSEPKKCVLAGFSMAVI
jgi:hypothetical protein